MSSAATWEVKYPPTLSRPRVLRASKLRAVAPRFTVDGQRSLTGVDSTRWVRNTSGITAAKHSRKRHSDQISRRRESGALPSRRGRPLVLLVVVLFDVLEVGVDVLLALAGRAASTTGTGARSAAGSGTGASGARGTAGGLLCAFVHLFADLL